MTMKGGRKATPSRAHEQLALGSFLLLAALSLAEANFQRQQYHQTSNHETRSHLAARRAADDSRPLSRILLSQAASQEAPIVIGKFKAPAPERVTRQRMPKAQESMAQTMSASFRVSDNHEAQPEKVVHGMVAGKHQQRQVSAKIMVSDEGLNYPPSKLSADIYGNVAEIVTAPPDAVENDFLVPVASRMFGEQLQ